MKVFNHIFERLTSPENLFTAWEEFKKGKQSRKDVMQFETRLEQNLFQLQRELQSSTYKHGSYSAFTICDPKQRCIHKATVRDRILHHAVFKVLNPFFEPTFIAHSFSCRHGKGTHRAVHALERMLWEMHRNGTRSCFALKCDIHRFFASVDHEILLEMMYRRIKDKRVRWLLQEIITTFDSGQKGKGIPIGNLTSQLFANVYMNEFDQFVKHILKIRHYVRYTDDFVVVAENEEELQNLLPLISAFLEERLRLDLHPHKVTIRTYHQGIDFLGYVLLPYHRVLRTKTKRRIQRKLQERVADYRVGHITKENAEQSLHSYLGVLSHADAYGLSEELRNEYWFEMHENDSAPHINSTNNGSREGQVIEETERVRLSFAKSSSV